MLPVVSHAKTGRVYVKAAIDSIAIFIGQQVNLTVDVTADRGAKIAYPTFERAQFITPGVEVLRTSDADTSLIDNGMMTVSKTFTLTSFDEKLYAIPGMKVSVDGKVYAANQLALKVLSVEVDTLHLDKFFPPKDVQDNPFDWSEWSGVFWMSVVVLLLCMLCCYLAVCLKQNKPVMVRIRVIKKVLPHQKAMTVIERLRKEKMNSSENQKEYYTQLTDALRQYIKERFGFNAMEMTSTEILDRLRENGDQNMLDELKELYRRYYEEDSFIYLVEDTSLQYIIGTNNCFIRLDAQGSKLAITSCIDNMMKGCAGQAVHNMNLMFNLEETTGLRQSAIMM